MIRCDTCLHWKHLGRITGREIGMCIAGDRIDPPNSIADFTHPHDKCECHAAALKAREGRGG